MHIIRKVWQNKTIIPFIHSIISIQTTRRNNVAPKRSICDDKGYVA